MVMKIVIIGDDTHRKEDELGVQAIGLPFFSDRQESVGTEIIV